MNRFYKGDKCKKCRKLVTIKNRSGHCRSCRMLGNTNTLGRKMSSEQRQHLSVIRMGENNPNWKGNEVGYEALHSWLKDRIKKPKFCKECKKNPPCDLANKGIYNRDVKNWEWLCRRCHMKKDGRIKNLKQYVMEKNKKKKK